MAASTYKVFLSHSSKDKEFVSKLYRRLTRDGVSCFLDEKSIHWGDNCVLTLEEGLNGCEYFVPILSPDFCESKWVLIERTSILADDPANEKRKVRPLMLRSCRHLPSFLKQVQSIDVSTDALFDANYEKICRDLGGVPQVQLDHLDRTALPPVELDESQNPIAQGPTQSLASHQTVIDNASTLESSATTLVLQFLQHSNKTDDATMQALDALLPHAEQLIASRSLAPDLAISLAGCIGTHHQAFGRYQAAKHFKKTALSLAQKSYPPGHHGIGYRQWSLAPVLQALGELSEARDLFRSALASIEQIASPGHLIILVHQSKLARVLLDLGELSEARDMLRSVLASAEKCYPQNDPSFARHQFDLAMVLKDLGELTEARDLLNHAYDALLNLLGADHPDTKTVKRNLDSL